MSGEKWQDDGGNRVLALDDSREVLALVMHVASKIGYVTRGAHTVGEFTRLFAEFRPTLVLLDIVIGEDDAMPVLDFIGAQPGNVPIILMSGHDGRIMGSVQVLAQARGLKIVGAVRKQIGFEKFEALLRKHYHSPQARQYG
jgi:DNA-binding response OmpR family regulator